MAARPGLSGFAVLQDGAQALLSRTALATQAAERIDLQYYIYAADHSGLALLQHLAAAADRGVKVRLLVDDALRITAAAAPLQENLEPMRVRLATQPMPPADAFIWHKTTRRTAYATFAPQPGCFDTLLYNAQGEVTEFTIGNVVAEIGGRWLTPPVSSGLLPGVMRQSLLDAGRIHESVISLDDLQHATQLALINSVRGWMTVELTPD